MPDPATSLSRLEADGLVRHDDVQLRTTRRWQGAMARAARRLRDAGDDSEDLRLPIAIALLDVYGTSLDDDAIVELVAAMLPVELAELGVR